MCEKCTRPTLDKITIAHSADAYKLVPSHQIRSRVIVRYTNLYPFFKKKKTCRPTILRELANFSELTFIIIK